MLPPPAPPNQQRQLSAQDWETQRPRIEQLYSTEDKSLDDVMSAMEMKYGFRATYVILFCRSMQHSLCKILIYNLENGNTRREFHSGI
jgi:hypothetical protein